MRFFGRTGAIAGQEARARTLFPPKIFSSRSTAASGAAYRSLQIAKLRMAVAAISYEKANQRANSFDIGPIDYGAAIARAAD